MGRAREITPQDELIVERAAGAGLTQKYISALLGMSERWLRDHMREPENEDDPDPPLLAAYKKGRADVASEVAGLLIDLCREKDRAAIFFYLKTQCGWRETNNLDVTSGGATIAMPPSVVFEVQESPHKAPEAK